MGPLSPWGTGRGLEVAVLGTINWDTTVFESEFAGPGEEARATRIEEFPGGKGANTAVAAARILGRGSVAFLGALGSDRLKGPLLESLQSEGVQSQGIATIKGAGTGRAFIIVDSSGRKAIHTHFGANDDLKPRHLRTGAASAVLSAVSNVVIMDVPTTVAAEAVAKTTKPHRRIIYSPGARSGEGGEIQDHLLRSADDLVLDRSELARLSGASDPSAGVDVLRRRYPDLRVVATMGPDGCLVSEGRKVGTVPPVDLADFGLRAVNSTGSGDAFIAAYACYALLGIPPLEAALWGNLAGALKAANPATRGSPTRVELERRMNALAGVRGLRPG